MDFVIGNIQKIDQNITQIRQSIDRIGTNKDGDHLRINL
jgi:hypothetical protein